VPPPQRGDDVDVEEEAGEKLMQRREMKVRVILVLHFMVMKVVIFR